MIKATLYLELSEIRQVTDPQAMAIFNRAAEIEAEKHDYELAGEAQVTGGGPDPWLLVWEVKTRG